MANLSKFDQRITVIPSSLLTLIASIDEIKGRWAAGMALHPQVLSRLKQSVLVTSTGSSTRIEGSKLSDTEIEELMKGIAIQEFKDRDAQEVRGYFELLKNVFNLWQTIKLRESTILHFHRELLKYVEKDFSHRGRYKKTENKVQMIDGKGKVVGTLFETTPVYLTGIEMQDLLEWTADALSMKKHHPLLIIGNFIIEFLKIHPFTDGNGRLSRILTNLLMLQAGYLYIPYISHEKLIEEKKQEYYLALRKSQKTFSNKADLTDWLEFFLSVSMEQAKRAAGLLSLETVEKLLSEKQMAVLSFLSEKKEASPMEIARATKILRPTINQILNKLLLLKKAERIGMGRSTRYRIRE